MGCVPSMRPISKPSSPSEPTSRREVGTDYCPPSNGTQMGSRLSHENPVDPDCNDATCQHIPSCGADGGGHSRALQPTEEEDLGKDCQRFLEESTCAQGLPNGDYLFIGPMRIQRQTMSVLLVFPRRDTQCEAFEKAASNGSYRYDVVHTAEAAVQSYFEYHHEVIIIDTRLSKGFDALELCSHIRATHNSDHTVIVALRQQSNGEQHSMLTLLQAGFNRQFVENPGASFCLDELQCLEHGEVASQAKLKAARAFVTAVENCGDAVEITAENHEIQYVNPTFEKLFGCAGKEAIGKKFVDLSRIEKTKPDVIESINTRIQNGKHWDGVYQIRRESGGTLIHKCRVYPVLGQSGKICHVVAIRSTIAEQSVTEHPYVVNIASSPVGEPGGVRRIRKESVAKLPPMTLEAPITKVINMLVSLQESSSFPVVESLDKILEVLRSSELYAPYVSKQVRDDKMTSELVGGLMTVDEDLLHHRRMSVAKRTSYSSDKPLYNRLPSQVPTVKINSPEVQALLDNEMNWDFDIIQLERLTHKRPLVHLAMQTFLRFDVNGFLRVEESVLCSWLHMIESNYHATNPYHNSTHAADVMHATAYFLGCDRIKNIFVESDQVASLIAAVVHDLDHPGKTNSFLVNSNADLAVLYNDQAVLECHHVSTAYRLTLKDPNVNIFKNLARDDYRSLRQQVVDMVLATEMTKHFEHLNRFVSVINQSPDDASDNGFDLADDESHDRLSTIENQTLIKRMMIKCADVSNPARPLNLCVEWAKRIAEEYCHQTDAEKAQNLPVVMPAFDSRACNIPRTQTTFIDFFINDMFEAWTKFCSLPDMSYTLKENYIYWKTQEEVIAKQLSENIAHVNGGGD